MDSIFIFLVKKASLVKISVSCFLASIGSCWSNLQYFISENSYEDLFIPELHFWHFL